MTLAFSETINNKPSFFIAKIWRGLPETSTCSFVNYCYSRYFDKFGKTVALPDEKVKPKLHTIRLDQHNRWHTGMAIHPVINNRSKNRFQFAPTLTCHSTQKIQISYIEGEPWVAIDDTILIFDEDVEKLAINDGFDDAKSFFEYFNTDFEGKIIHWTDLKY